LRSILLSAAALLCAATMSLAQSPPPAAPILPEPVPVVGATVVSGSCLTGKCAGGAPCVPEVKPAKKTVYSTVTREYCLPTHSFFDSLMKCCGMGDDCDGPTGETRTKTLLVKKQVPKCEQGCGTCKTGMPATTVIVPAPAVSTKP